MTHDAKTSLGHAKRAAWTEGVGRWGCGWGVFQLNTCLWKVNLMPIGQDFKNYNKALPRVAFDNRILDVPQFKAALSNIPTPMK